MLFNIQTIATCISSTPTRPQLVKAREEERTRAIREGKMDDPTVAKRLEDAITIVGTCQDMCPEFERYRRERENNLDKWECVRLYHSNNVTRTPILHFGIDYRS